MQNHHTIEDVKRLRSVLTTAELLVRVNPIHDALPDYPSSETEIDAAIEAGADIIMLPYFKTADELYQMNIRVVNLNETKRRKQLANLYYTVNSFLPF